MVGCTEQSTIHFFFFLNQTIALSKILVLYQSVSIRCEAPLRHEVESTASDHLSLLKFYFILSVFSFFIFSRLSRPWDACGFTLDKSESTSLLRCDGYAGTVSRSQTSCGCELYWSRCKIRLAALPGGVWFHCIFSGGLFLPVLFGADFLCFLS